MDLEPSPNVFEINALLRLSERIIAICDSNPGLNLVVALGILFIEEAEDRREFIVSVIERRSEDIRKSLSLTYAGRFHEDDVTVAHFLECHGYQTMIMGYACQCLCENRPPPRSHIARKIYYALLAGKTTGMCGENYMIGVQFSKSILVSIAKLPFLRNVYKVTDQIHMAARIADNASPGEYAFLHESIEKPGVWTAQRRDAIERLTSEPLWSEIERRLNEDTIQRCIDGEIDESEGPTGISDEARKYLKCCFADWAGQLLSPMNDIYDYNTAVALPIIKVFLEIIQETKENIDPVRTGWVICAIKHSDELMPEDDAVCEEPVRFAIFIRHMMTAKHRSATGSKVTRLTAVVRMLKEAGYFDKKSTGIFVAAVLLDNEKEIFRDVLTNVFTTKKARISLLKALGRGTAVQERNVLYMGLAREFPKIMKEGPMFYVIQDLMCNRATLDSGAAAAFIRSLGLRPELFMSEIGSKLWRPEHAVIIEDPPQRPTGFSIVDFSPNSPLQIGLTYEDPYADEGSDAHELGDTVATITEFDIEHPMVDRTWRNVECDVSKLGSFAKDILKAHPRVVLSGSSPVRAATGLPQTSDCDFYVQIDDAVELIRTFQKTGYRRKNNYNAAGYGDGIQLIRMTLDPVNGNHRAVKLFRSEGQLIQGANPRKYVTFKPVEEGARNVRFDYGPDTREAFEALEEQMGYVEEVAEEQLNLRVYRIRDVISATAYCGFSRKTRIRSSCKTTPLKDGLPNEIDIIVTPDAPLEFIAREFDLSVCKTAAMAKADSIEIKSLYPDHLAERKVAFAFDRNMTFNLQKRKTMMSRFAKYCEHFEPIEGSVLIVSEQTCNNVTDYPHRTFLTMMSRRVSYPTQDEKITFGHILNCAENYVLARAHHKNFNYGSIFRRHSNLDAYERPQEIPGFTGGFYASENAECLERDAYLAILADPFPDKELRMRTLIFTSRGRMENPGQIVKANRRVMDVLVANIIENVSAGVAIPTLAIISQIPFFWLLVHGPDYFETACENYKRSQCSTESGDLRTVIRDGILRARQRWSGYLNRPFGPILNSRFDRNRVSWAWIKEVYRHIVLDEPLVEARAESETDDSDDSDDSDDTDDTNDSEPEERRGAEPIWSAEMERIIHHQMTEERPTPNRLANHIKNHTVTRNRTTEPHEEPLAEPHEESDGTESDDTASDDTDDEPGELDVESEVDFTPDRELTLEESRVVVWFERMTRTLRTDIDLCLCECSYRYYFDHDRQCPAYHIQDAPEDLDGPNLSHWIRCIGSAYRQNVAWLLGLNADDIRGLCPCMGDHGDSDFTCPANIALFLRTALVSERTDTGNRGAGENIEMSQGRFSMTAFVRISKQWRNAKIRQNIERFRIVDADRMRALSVMYPQGTTAEIRQLYWAFLTDGNNWNYNNDGCTCTHNRLCALTLFGLWRSLGEHSAAARHEMLNSRDIYAQVHGVCIGLVADELRTMTEYLSICEFDDDCFCSGTGGGGSHHALCRIRIIRDIVNGVDVSPRELSRASINWIHDRSNYMEEESLGRVPNLRGVQPWNWPDIDAIAELVEGTSEPVMREPYDEDAVWPQSRHVDPSLPY